MNDKKLYYETPTQVAFYDVDGNHWNGGIAYQDKIICGCCGGLIDISELYELAPEGVNPVYVYKTWIDINDDICGGEKPADLDIED